MGQSADINDRLCAALGARVVGWQPTKGGYTPSLRGIASLDDGRTVFVKAATHDFIGGWLRREHQLYTALAGAPFLPRLVGFLDDALPALPVLVLEDLSAARWPPPWSPVTIEAVQHTLAAVQRCRPPGLTLAAFADSAELMAGWGPVAAAPAAFLGLGLVSARWLHHALPRLQAAGAHAPVEGEALLHMDVRSDNLCWTAARGALLIDWNHAMQGNAGLDRAFWAPSLWWEGGPPPEVTVGEGAAVAGWAALVSGFFAARAGLPVVPLAPQVREVQRTQLCAALPWVIRALGLPPADGPQAETLLGT